MTATHRDLMVRTRESEMLALAHGPTSSTATKQSKRAALQPPPIAQKGVIVDSAPRGLYPDEPEYCLTIFDVRIPGTAERLHREREGWGDDADIEALDQDHYALVVKPGGARRLVS